MHADRGESSGRGRARQRPSIVVFAAIAAVAIVAAACSSDDSSSTSASGPKTSSSNASTTATKAPDRPAGPAATLTPLTGGKGVFIAAASPESLAGTGYVQHEYAAAGTATSYTGNFPQNGRSAFTPTGSASYRTRILVRRPSDPSKFSGTVAVEWLNVSGGVDADPDWTTLHEELTRRGDIWVGVSAQIIGVMGGPVLVTAPGGEGIAGKGLRGIDPARYGSLSHPGDGYSFDIYTQVARALRAGGSALGGMTPKHVIAVGESQSAFALVTYVDGVQPLTHAFDGFFVHSRGAAPLPIAAPGKPAGIADSISKPPVIFRTDQTVPIMDFQTETDVTSVLGSLKARQPDSNAFRLWETPGTAHADKHLVGPTASKLDCGVPINNGPAHVVAKAAYNALGAWVDDGTLPPTAPRIEVTTGATPAIKRNTDGIALGGVRTPPVDVPVDVLSGQPGPNPSTICLLLGSTKPLPDSRIAQLYPSRDAYQQRYDADADKAIKAGFVLQADRAALLAFAQPDRIKG